jgi:c-di-AMP phosphodiesterase-like protein
MKHLKHIKKFNELEENLNISDVRSSKKFEVEIKGDNGKVIFFDIIEAKDLNDAFDKSTDIVGVQNITLHDEVDINIKEVK